MVDKTKEVRVTNRDRGRVGYRIPDLNLYREFSPGETKTLAFDELQKLVWARGGLALLKDYLIIEDEEVVQELLGQVEPEYYYTEAAIKKLLTEGTLDQLQDTLNYAPKGVIDLIKKLAVELPLNNVAMRKLIFDQIHFDVDNAVKIDMESKQLDDDIDAASHQRKANPIAATKLQQNTGRKAAPIIIKK